MLNHPKEKYNIEKISREDKIFYTSLSNDELHTALINASYNGNLQTIYELIHHTSLSSELTSNRFIETLNQALFYACSTNRLDIIHFLLTSHHLPEKPDIYMNEEQCLSSAFRNEHLEVVKVLLLQSQTQRPFLMLSNVDLLTELQKGEKEEIINYIIFDYKIQYTQRMDKYLNLKHANHLINKFKRRSLENTLHKELIEKEPLLKKIKI